MVFCIATCIVGNLKVNYMSKSKNILFGLSFLLASCSGSLNDLTTNALSGNISNPTAGSKLDLGNAMSAGKNLYDAASLSDEDVIKAARESVKYSDKTKKVAPANSKYAKRLAKITANAKNEGGLNLNYKVYLTSQINACAFPDGSVRVNSGLLEKMNDDELLFIIGHEVGHVKEGHRKAKLRLAYIAAAGRSGVAAASGTIAGALASSEIGGLAEELINAQFSQSEESSADKYGLDFLQRHNIKQSAAVTALEKLASVSESSGNGMFSTHPAAKDRAASIAEKINYAKSDVSEKNADKHALNKAVPSEDKDEELPIKKHSLEEDNNNYQKKAEEPSAPADLNQAEENSNTEEPNNPNRKWYVQVSAETELEVANEKIAKLAQLGRESKKQLAVVNNTTYYRVLVGPFSSYNSAKLSLSEISELSLNNNDDLPFIREFE